ncbi:MAG: arginase family protein [archaeon]
MNTNFQVIKVPGINGLGKTKGTRNAGNAILAELRNIKSNEKGKPISVSLLDLEEAHVDNNNLEEQEELIYKNSKEAFEGQDKVIFLGGDHSITYSIGRAFFDFWKDQGEQVCLIVFDAHADCMPPIKHPTHEEWLRALIEYGFPAENILLVGARNIEQEELVFLNEKHIKRIEIQWLNENLGDVTDSIMEFAGNKKLYVSLDIDVVDPVYAPSTGYSVAGGLTSREIIYIIKRLNLKKNLKAVDIAEIDSEKDKKNNSVTIKLGAKILAELL